MIKLHKFLQTPLYRKWMLFPFTIICALGLLTIGVHVAYEFNFSIPMFIRYMYIISALILIINGVIIIWSDNEIFKSRLK